MARSGINDIANELLEAVFLYYVEAWHSNRWETRVLLHICSRWTSIAIAKQLRWLLNRSGNAPLHIFSTDWIHLRPGQLIADADKDTQKLLLSECFRRMESLELNVDASAMAPFFTPSWSLHAPRLAHLVVAPLEENDYGNREGLPKFIAQGCPMLVQLEFRDQGHLPYLSVLPETLEILRLHSASSTSSGPFTLDCIAPLKNLRVLDLSGNYILQPIYHDSSVFSGPLELPNMETLRFSNASIRFIQNILRELDTPPPTSLYIDSRVDKLTDDISELCEALAWISQPIDDAIDRLLVEFSASKFTASWSRSWTSVDDDNSPADIHLSLFLPGSRNTPREDKAMRAIIVRFCKALTGETLSQVYVKYLLSQPNLFKPDDWLETFGSPSLEGMTELVIDSCPWIWDFIRSLYESYEVSDDGEPTSLSQRPFFPALKRLTLRRADIEDASTVFRAYRADADPEGANDTLEGMLTARREMGAGIEELTLDGCEGLGEADYDRLRAVVNVLHVPTTGEEVNRSLFGDH
ncbi:hypothetical protein DL96DRAFT_1628695 [Flagelloscypha sp. PMI_526]|nr:hypothetical protein DL96DRAFT_1628695 [Flagelloscypha sp. PMI_526]